METSVNILIVGVGGQGTLLASKLLGYLAIASEYDVKVSELHGMAQRGGSVVTHVRFGKDVHSPLVDLGTADYIVAFEKLEALRYVNYLKPDGTIIVNTEEILPMPVIMRAAEYPDDVLEQLKNHCGTLEAIDATGIARSLGNARAMNTVLLSVLARHLSFSHDLWQEGLDKVIPAKLLDLNKKAFDAGYAAK